MLRIGKEGLKLIKNISRDQAKREFKKHNKDIIGSKTFSKKVAKKKSKEGNKPILEKHGEGYSHAHSPDRKAFNKKEKGAHAFYEDPKTIVEKSVKTSIIVPGATAGQDLLGDNLAGKAVDFFNPVSDIQDVVELTPIIEEVIEDSAEVVNEAIDAATEVAVEKAKPWYQRIKEKLNTFLNEMVPDTNTKK